MDFLKFQDISNEDIFNYLMKNGKKIVEIPFRNLPALSNTYYITSLEGDDLKKNNYFGFYPYYYSGSTTCSFYPCQYEKVWVIFKTFKYNGEILYFDKMNFYYEGYPNLNPYKKNSYYLSRTDYSFTCEKDSSDFLLKIQYIEQLCLSDTKGIREFYESSSDFISSSKSYQGDDPLKPYFYCLRKRTDQIDLGHSGTQTMECNVIDLNFSTFLLKNEQETIEKMIEIDKYINREYSYLYAKERGWENIQEDTDEGPINANSFFPYPTKEEIFGN